MVKSANGIFEDLILKENILMRPLNEGIFKLCYRNDSKKQIKTKVM
jgi:hypothetical protein